VPSGTASTAGSWTAACGSARQEEANREAGIRNASPTQVPVRNAHDIMRAVKRAAEMMG